MRTLVGYELSRSKFSLVGWAFGLSAACILYLSVYPSMEGAQMQEMLASLPPKMVAAFGMEHLTSGAHYAHATFFALLGYAIPATAAVLWGTHLFAGRLSRGDVEVIVSHGVRRTEYFSAALVTLALRLLVLALVIGVVVAGLNSPAGLDIRPVNLVAEVICWWLLCLVVGTVSLTVGAATGRPAVAGLAGGLVAAGGYGLVAVAALSPTVDKLVWISPYHWAYRTVPLANGFDWLGLCCLLLCQLALIVVGLIVARSRDMI